MLDAGKVGCIDTEALHHSDVTTDVMTNPLVDPRTPGGGGAEETGRAGPHARRAGVVGGGRGADGTAGHRYHHCLLYD
jgi:hypothetical protein